MSKSDTEIYYNNGMLFVNEYYFRTFIHLKIYSSNLKFIQFSK